MRRLFVGQRGIGLVRSQLCNPLRECGSQGIEFIQLFLLLIDSLVQYIQQIFLMRELALQRDKAFFVFFVHDAGSMIVQLGSTIATLPMKTPAIALRCATGLRCVAL